MAALVAQEIGAGAAVVVRHLCLASAAAGTEARPRARFTCFNLGDEPTLCPAVGDGTKSRANTQVSSLSPSPSLSAYHHIP